MAEWGQKDERWIVENREDGQNINQWHWSEKNCDDWARQRFDELLTGLELLPPGDSWARVTAVDSVNGEAFLNVRKKKLIPTYELEVTCSFTGRARQDAADVSGKVVLPYLAEENHDEDPEVLVKPEVDNADARSLKMWIHENRLSTIIPKVRTFVEEFHMGVPAGYSGSASSRPVVKEHTSTAAATHKEGVRKPAMPAITASGAKRGMRDIEIKESFYASALDLYEALTSEKRIRAFTQSEASVQEEHGSAFTMFGGSIEGIQRELVPGKRVVQDWRFNNWPDGIFSKVELTISEIEPGHTEVLLKQTGIPEEDKFGNRDVVDTTENGWKNLIFHRIRSVFGYGV